MSNPKITSVGIAAALLLFSALLFGERAEAGALFPEGRFERGDTILHISPEGDYEIRFASGGKITGIALYEGPEVCTSNEKDGNLWAIDSGGTGACYDSARRGSRLIISNLNSAMTKPLAGIWTPLTDEEIAARAAEKAEAERAKRERAAARAAAKAEADRKSAAAKAEADRKSRQKEEERMAKQLASFPISECPKSSEQMTAYVRLALEQGNRGAYEWLSRCPRD